MTIKGSCHCGATQFEVSEAPASVTHCTCSFCSKRGALHAYYTPGQFKLTTARDRVVGILFGDLTVAVVFVSATLLGFASHAPGGLGVFDAAMMVALWQFDKEDLLAGLLLFRLLYYIIPFVISLGVLGIREALLSRAARRISQATSPPINVSNTRVRDKSDLS